MRKKMFIDYLFDLFVDLADTAAEPVVLVKNFLGHLPGVRYDKTTKKQILLQGVIEEAGERIQFRFLKKKSNEVKVVITRNSPFGSLNYAVQWVIDLFAKNKGSYVGSWADATQWLTDKVSPGDRLMSLDTNRNVLFFSYEEAKI